MEHPLRDCHIETVAPQRKKPGLSARPGFFYNLARISRGYDDDASLLPGEAYTGST